MSATFIVDTSGTPRCKSGANFYGAYFLDFYKIVFFFLYNSANDAKILSNLLNLHITYMNTAAGRLIPGQVKLTGCAGGGRVGIWRSVMTRTKSAVIVFVVLAAAVVAAVSIDYTDTYVADRFRKAFIGGRYAPGEPFSLDTFLEYYDWDRVCICSGPAACDDFTTILGMAYKPVHDPLSEWSLLLTKSGHVAAEIPIKRDVLAPPYLLPGQCFERWQAIAVIMEGASGKRMEFIAE